RSYGDWSSDVCSSDLGADAFDLHGRLFGVGLHGLQIDEAGAFVEAELADVALRLHVRLRGQFHARLLAGVLPLRFQVGGHVPLRSEERRVGKEGSSMR